MTDTRKAGVNSGVKEEVRRLRASETGTPLPSQLKERRDHPRWLFLKSSATTLIC
jgi:hypothetical protein